MLRLEPTIEFLREEYVLVQAWKKAHDYIRYHNWYADVLELDRSAAELPAFIKSLQNDLAKPEKLRSQPLRLVMAPKRSEWDIIDGIWAPKPDEKLRRVKPPLGEDEIQCRTLADLKRKLRPLSHVSIRDQTLAVAFMMCLADAVETKQGDPSMPLAESRKKQMASYGNRLFCDEQEDGTLRYRWANSSTYRKWHQDYKQFVKRPRNVASHDFPDGKGFAIVHADLSQFFDRVRPPLLRSRMEALFDEEQHDDAFFTAFKRFFRWSWHSDDIPAVEEYVLANSPLSASGDSLKGMVKKDGIALPQGLVASGFFSNVALLDFDCAIWRVVGKDRGAGRWRIVDYCRYVDDLRFVVACPNGTTPNELREQIYLFLKSTLEATSPGLVVNEEKVKVLLDRGSSPGEIAVSDSVERIQENVSGAMDIETAQTTLQMIEGLDALSTENDFDFGSEENFLTTDTDIRDDTLARFAAGRWRSTYRSLRPMLPETWNVPETLPRKPTTRDEVDHRAAFYSRRLIEHWLRDPSQMRLLRLGLDIYPDGERLDLIRKNLTALVDSDYPETQPLEFINTAGKKRITVSQVNPKQIFGWYCIAELFKAGATETGFVSNEDELPSQVSVEDYRRELTDWAVSLASQNDRCPWYVVQQVMLFLATRGVASVHHFSGLANDDALDDYFHLHDLLQSGHAVFQGVHDVSFLRIWQGLNGDAEPPAKCLAMWVGAHRDEPAVNPVLKEVCETAPELANAVWKKLSPTQKKRWRPLFRDFGYVLDKHQTFVPAEGERR